MSVPPDPAAPAVTSSGVPILLHSERLRVLCVGGGPVAAGKVAALIGGGARVRVVAPDAVESLRAAADAGHIVWERRAYRRGDVGDAQLVVAGTSRADVNAAVATEADAAGRLCVRVDDAGGGTAAFMGAVRRGPIVVGVSTSGAAPGLTRLLRDELERRVRPEHGRLAMLWGELRANDRVVEAMSELDRKTRRARWRALYRSDILDLIRAGKLAEAKEAALACLLSSSD